MSNVDWSKAPEGATHYVVDRSAFYKMYNGVLMISGLTLCRDAWVESSYRDIDELSEMHDVIERPKPEEVDMNKQVFKVGDKVYCPIKGCRVYTIKPSNCEIYQLFVEGMILTLSGRSLQCSANPHIIHATPENKAMLEQLYRTEFEAPPVKLSGSNLTRAKLKETGKPILCCVSDSSDQCATSTKRVVLIVTSEESGCLRFITSAGIPYHYAVPYTGDEFLTGKDFE